MERFDCSLEFFFHCCLDPVYRGKKGRFYVAIRSLGNVFLYLSVYDYGGFFYYGCVMNESLLIGRTMSHSGEKGKISLFLWVSLNGDVSSNVEMRIFLFLLFSVNGENQLCGRLEKEKEIKKLGKNSKNELDIIRVGASKVNFYNFEILFFEKCTFE